MTIISLLEDPAIVKRILLYLNLWEVPERSPPARPILTVFYTFYLNCMLYSTR
jgi:hypothetical protein